jgi:hypothetical protein
MNPTEFPSLSERVAHYRARQAEGTLTIDDMREFIRAVREGRLNAAESTKRVQAKKVIRSAEDLLGDFK